ncbi:MAG TPA: hypothetical protein VI877_04090 [Dehalococcoidia bacterium]|nr:hypothetical protein [Dehalococcoidia bacterium]
MEAWLRSIGLIAAGLFAIGLGLVALAEDREIARREARHVRSVLQSRLYLWIGRALDLGLIGGGLLILARGVSRILNLS